jgi:signal transduction histidine kinase
MHDNIGIQLMGALHSPSATRKDALIRETLGDLRDIISNANRSDMPLADLLADLRASLGEHLLAAGIALDWQAGAEVDAPLSQRQSHALRSILREAVGNVMRHAQASRVVVRVSVTRAEGAAMLEMIVDDNGRGPDLEPERQMTVRPGGNGLANMRARAAGLGGHVTVVAGPSGGTRVQALLPLDRPKPERQVS